MTCTKPARLAPRFGWIFTRDRSERQFDPALGVGEAGLEIWIPGLYLLTVLFPVTLVQMSTASAAAPVANGHAGPNGATKMKSSAAKSRGALKRLKAKQKAKGGNASAASESEAENGAESDMEVSGWHRVHISMERLKRHVCT